MDRFDLTHELTNWYHALSIVVEVFLDDLQQALNRSPRAIPSTLAIAAKILILLLHFGKRHG